MLALTLLAGPASVTANAQDAASDASRPRTTGTPVETSPLDGFVRRLTRGSFTLVDASGKIIGERRRGDETPVALSETAVLEMVAAAPLTREQAAALWEFYAGEGNASLATLPIIKALVAASSTPSAREPLWSELAGLLKTLKDRQIPREQSLLGLFERHRDSIWPLLTDQRATEPSGDDMVELMLASRVFGSSLEQGIVWLSERNPAALARRIERDRGKGQPVHWENTAFQAMVRWKDARLIPGAKKAPTTMEELDAASEAFITIFNCLHAMDDKYRETMLRGLGPTDVFNAVIGGETELYRMGTSGYHKFLHEIIMRGIAESGSFEAFVDKAIPRRLGPEAIRASGSRSMVFLRVASSFGLFDDVLAKVRDRDRFIDDAIASLGDARSFEGNSSVVMDVLVAQTGSSAAAGFRRALLDKLYDRYRTETLLSMRSVFGSMLSVYQTVTGNRRDPAIDREYPLNDAMFKVPFNRLFTSDDKGGHTHRMFVRMDQDVDAVMTYANFRNAMRSRGASVRNESYFDVYRISSRGRTIELYVNHPTAAGVRRGIPGIAAALRGRRVETVIGRGHTSIIAPLQDNAKLVLGEQIKNVAVVLVGTCGGDASVRKLIGTFGYMSYFTTRSTGRLSINNAIIETYIDALMKLTNGGRLTLEDVMDRATSRFMRKGADEDLRDDAKFYRLAMTTVLTAFLFDNHVRRYVDANKLLAQQ
jgi:hypothetical protein